MPKNWRKTALYNGQYDPAGCGSTTLVGPQRRSFERAESAGAANSHGAARIGLVLVSSRVRRRMPGRTGVSHWVEHMNFKGTTNIPREEMKGIVERFGGMWNGYTWIDQTTYLETAGRGALDQMLFIEAERMAHGLYDRAECESERTVIISELQGGENDPDQLLDTEVTATAFRAHPYRHPTIGWLEDLQIDVARRSVRPLPPVLRPEQCHAGRRR